VTDGGFGITAWLAEHDGVVRFDPWATSVPVEHRGRYERLAEGLVLAHPLVAVEQRVGNVELDHAIRAA
jgi:hypothetical protein